MLITPGFWKLRQEDGEFEVSLGYRIASKPV